MRSRSRIRLLFRGFVVGSLLVMVCFLISTSFNSRNYSNNQEKEIWMEKFKSFDEKLSRHLEENVRILCMVITHPENTKTKAIHVKNTWGQRCTKLLFMTSAADLELETVVLELNENTEGLYNKTLMSFRHAYDHHLDDFDWFLKADDDSFVVMENLRHLLYQYNPKTSLLIGHRFSTPYNKEGSVAGGHYVLSKKALRKLFEKLVHEKEICQPHDEYAEDVELSSCFEHSAIIVDTRDINMQYTFFPVGIEYHLEEVPEHWYKKYQYYQVVNNNLSCCSDVAVAFHYVGPHNFYNLEYFIYNVHPFGIADKSDELRLPKKLSLKKVIAASDVKSLSPFYKNHKFRHNLDDSEWY